MGATKDLSAYCILATIAERILEVPPAFCASLWISYATILENKSTFETFELRFPKSERASCKLQSVLRYHACELLQQQIKLDAESVPDDFLNYLCGDDYDDDNSELHDELKIQFDRILALQPDVPKYWSGYIEYLKNDEKKVRNRAIENFVKHCPDEPRALELAATEAHQRKAFDKAFRFVERALEVEPMNRAFRVLQCTLLVEKARKKIAAGAYPKASELYAEAVGIEYLPSADKVAPLTELVLFEKWYGGGLSTQEVDSFEQLSIDISQGPWSLEAEKVQSARHLEKALKKRNLFTPRCPERAPDGADITRLIDMLRTDEDFFRSEDRLFSLYLKAVEGGYANLTNFEDVKLCLKWFTNPAIEFSLVERALELKTDKDKAYDILLSSKYELALHLKKDASCFETAISELKAARQREEERCDTSWGFSSDLLEEIDDVVQKIRRYLSTTGRKAQKNDAASASKKSSRQQPLPF